MQLKLISWVKTPLSHHTHTPYTLPYLQPESAVWNLSTVFIHHVILVLISISSFWVGSFSVPAFSDLFFSLRLGCFFPSVSLPPEAHLHTTSFFPWWYFLSFHCCGCSHSLSHTSLSPFNFPSSPWSQTSSPSLSGALHLHVTYLVWRRKQWPQLPSITGGILGSQWELPPAPVSKTEVHSIQNEWNFTLVQLLVINTGSCFPLKSGHAAGILALKSLLMSFLFCLVISSEKNWAILDHVRGPKGSSVFLVHITD